MGVAAVVAAGTMSGASFAHPVPGDGTGWTRPEVTGYDKAVTGRKVPVKPRELDPPGKPAPKPKWPRTGSATVSIPSAVAGGKQQRAKAGELPVWIAGGESTTGGTVKVAVLDRARARKSGVNGIIVTVTGVDGTSSRGLTVGLDYSGFADGFGGDYGHRLRLVQLPACALTTPSRDRKSVV